MTNVVLNRRAARLARALPLILAVAALPAASAQYVCGGSCHVVNGTVFDGSGGPFLAGHVYIVNGTLSVPSGQTLTIGAGAIVKFDGIHSLNVSGTLVASGTAGSPIVVTSIHDDVGGDHNGNGGASTPAPGQWLQIWFGPGSGASSLTHLTMRYGGWAGYPQLHLDGCNASFTNCVFSSPGLDCVYFGGNSAPIMTGCAFVGGSKAATAVPITALPGFSGCTATGQTLRDAPEVTTASITGPLSLSVDDTFNGSGAIAVTTSITVQTTGSLTLGPGVVIKFDGIHSLNAYGPLHSNGTTGSPAVLTSIHDDVHGGDTNRNSNASVGGAGQWLQLWFGPDSDASIATSLRVRCAGWAGYPGVQLDASNSTFSDLRTDLIGGPCMSLQNNSFPTATNCKFDGGTNALVNASIGAMAGFSGCTAFGNVVYDAPEITTAAIGPGGSVALVADDAFNGNGVFVVHTSISVDATASLSLDAGVKLKFNGVHALNSYGVTTTTGSGGAPVVLTSIHDDAQGGDTNKNAAASLVAPGQWVQAWFGPSSDASNLAGLVVRAAGWAGNPSMLFDQSDATLSDCSVGISGGPCLDLTNSSYPTATNCALNGGNYAATNVRLRALEGMSGVTASGNSVYDAPLVTSGGVNVGENVALTAGNTFNASGVVVVQTSITVANGGFLALDAGLIVKFNGVHACNVYGVLTTTGTTTPTTPGTPVVFTSVSDDVYGGDTNKDGGASSGVPGQWIQMWFGPNSDASSIAGTIFRCAGWAGYPGIQLDQSNLSMTTSRTALFGGPCIDLATNCAPSISFCAFDGGTIAANSVSIDALAGFVQNTATGNSQSDAPRVTGSTVSTGQTAVVRAINTFNGNGVLQFPNGATVNAGGVLDVGPGVVFKFPGVSSLNVYGTANFKGTGLEPIVLTSWTDDVFGGDSNLDGAASGPVHGQWIQIYAAPSATGAFEHVRVRCGGWGGYDMVEAHASGVAWNAVRFDLAGGRGLRVANAAGATLDNFVAWNCLGVGVRLETGHVLRHATIANCGGAGVDATGGATALNCVSHGNGGLGFSGFPSGAVNYSNGTGVVGGSFNISGDPLFQNAATGDVRLTASSPVIGGGEPFAAFTMVFDHVDACRISDGQLTGSTFPDMGAYEYVAYSMTVSGKPWSFGTVTVQVDGALPGVTYIAFGLGGAPQPIIPFGFLNLGPIDQITLLAFLPTGAPLTTTIPDVSAFAGSTFQLQALATPIVNPAVGSFTNTYFGTIDL